MCCQCRGLWEAETIESRLISRANKKAEIIEEPKGFEHNVRTVKGKYYGFPFSLSSLLMLMSSLK